MRVLTVAASAVSSLLEFAVSRGAARQALMQAAGIDPAAVQDRDNRIPFSAYVALTRAAQEACRDPALALHFGEAIDGSELSFPVGTAANFADVLAHGNRYAALVVEVETVGGANRFELVRDRGQLWFVDRRANPNEFSELTESAFARMVCTTRRFAGDTQVIKAIRVTHPAPAYRAEYDRIFRVPVAFDSDMNGLQIDEAIMARFSFPAPSKYVTGVLHDHAEKLLDKLNASESTSERVEQLLAPILHTGDVAVDLIAKELGLSRQTLFRRLKAEGTTFQQVVERLRHRLAIHHLTAQKTSVRETARLLGFSDASAFSRAFKRWTGVSPREYAASARRPRPSPAARG